MRRWVGALVVAAVLVAGLARAEDDAPLAPPFKLTSLAGETLELSVLLENGPVLLDFWATWCKPCVASMPGIEELHETYGARGLTIVGVSVDGPRNYSKVRPFASRLGLTYPMALDRDGKLQRDYRVAAFPSAVLIDTSGRVVYFQRGYRPGEHKTLGEVIETVLPEGDPSGDSGTAK